MVAHPAVLLHRAPPSRIETVHAEHHICESHNSGGTSDHHQFQTMYVDHILSQDVEEHTGRDIKDGRYVAPNPYRTKTIVPWALPS